MFSTGIIDASNPINWGHPLTRGLLSWWKNIPGTRVGLTVRDLNRKTNASGDWSDTNQNKLVGSPHRPGGHAAWRFDGVDDYVDLETSRSDFGIVDEMSVAYWLKRLAPAGNGWHTLIADWEDNKGRTVHAGIHFNQYFDVRYLLDNGVEYDVRTSWLPTPDVWYHCVSTLRIGDEARLYVDGKLEDTISTSGRTDWFDTSPSSSFVLGNKSILIVGNNNWFDGEADDIMLWNRTLSATEATALYHATYSRQNPMHRYLPITFKVPTEGSGRKTVFM